MFSKIRKIFLILFGNLLIALAVSFFIVPAGFITGGVTGVSLALEEIFNIPLSFGIAGISALLLLVAYITLGSEFAGNSAISTISFPIFVWISEELVKITNFKTDSIALNLLCSSLLFGYGIAIIMKQGASSGGFDTIALILNKKHGFSLSLAVTIFEIVSMSTQIYYSSINGIIGGILVVIIYTTIMNNSIARGVSKVQVQIYSREYKKINEIILSDFERGSTLFHIEGGYSERSGYALQTIVSNRELFKLKEAILNIDKSAFLTVSEISEVNGQGFSWNIDETKKRKSRK